MGIDWGYAVYPSISQQWEWHVVESAGKCVRWLLWNFPWLPIQFDDEACLLKLFKLVRFHSKLLVIEGWEFPWSSIISTPQVQQNSATVRTTRSGSHLDHEVHQRTAMRCSSAGGTGVDASCVEANTSAVFMGKNWDVFSCEFSEVDPSIATI